MPLTPYHIVVVSDDPMRVDSPSVYWAGCYTATGAMFDFGSLEDAERGAAELRRPGCTVEVRPGRHPIPARG